MWIDIFASASFHSRLIALLATLRTVGNAPCRIRLDLASAQSHLAAHSLENHRFPVRRAASKFFTATRAIHFLCRIIAARKASRSRFAFGPKAK